VLPHFCQFICGLGGGALGVGACDALGLFAVAALEGYQMSLRSGSVYKRRRNYPSEFVWKDGIWWVSAEFCDMFWYNWQARSIRNMAEYRSERLLNN